MTRAILLIVILTLALALSACHMKLDPPGGQAGYSPTPTATIQPTVTVTATPSVPMKKVNP